MLSLKYRPVSAVVLFQVSAGLPLPRHLIWLLLHFQLLCDECDKDVLGT